MKTFYHDKTLTVHELIELLEKYPADMPVLATWESVLTPFRGLNYVNPFNGEVSDYVTVETPERADWEEEPAEPCLIFDVDT